jgi:hypothetical protein
MRGEERIETQGQNGREDRKEEDEDRRRERTGGWREGEGGKMRE